MPFKEKINNNKKLKSLVHWLLIPSRQARPRRWVHWFVNPFYHKHGKYSLIKSRARMDVLPFNKFAIGEYSTIEDFCTINNGVGDVIIGRETFIGLGTVVIGPVNIGNSVMFAQNIVISGLNHSYENIHLPIWKQKVKTALINIEDECWIGANAVITAGVTIGKHSVVAAGSVVTKNIPAYSIAAGNPAKIIKQYDFEKKQWTQL
jgi:acetyltransferase-like isoleucine patch superfamily enzyme